MGDLDHAGPGRHGRAEAGDHVVGRGVGAAQRDLPDDDPVAAGPLVPGGLHPAVVLVADHDLVAGLEVDPGDQGLHPLGGVPGDRQLLGVAAELAGQLAADRLDPGFEQVPHVVRRGDVGEPEVADHRLQDGRRRGGDAAVVEVDQGPVGVEGPADLGPVILVAGDGVGGPAPGDLGPADQSGRRVAREDRRRRRARQEAPPIAHLQGIRLHRRPPPGPPTGPSSANGRAESSFDRRPATPSPRSAFGTRSGAPPHAPSPWRPPCESRPSSRC